MSEAKGTWRRVPLRHLAEFNPTIPSAIRNSDASLPLFPMDAIREFSPPSDPEVRPVNTLLQGYSYLDTTDVAYAKVTPCFENGKGVIGTDLTGPSFATTEVTVLRPLRGASQAFLAYSLQSAAFRSKAIASMTGAGGLKRVSEPEIKDFRLNFPDLSTQQDVTDYLDRETAEIDELIADLEIASRFAIEKSQSRWDDDLDRMGLDAESRPLKFCLSTPLSYGANLPADQVIDGDVRYLRITDFAMDGTIRESTRRTLPMNLAIDYMVEPGDILIARSGATVGKSFLVPNDSERACHAGYLIRARPSRAVNPNYLYATLNSTRFWHWVDQNKTVATIPNINAERYGQYRVPVPSLGAQENAVAKFEEAASARRAMLQDFDRAITLAKERRAALITAAVTGQIDVTAKRRPAAEQLEDDIKELS